MESLQKLTQPQTVSFVVLESLFHGDAEKLSYQVVIQEIPILRETARLANELACWCDGWQDETSEISLKKLSRKIGEAFRVNLEKLTPKELQKDNVFLVKDYWNNWLRQIEIEVEQPGHLLLVMQSQGTTL